MNEQLPYVVENKWLVYARNTMEATITYRNEIDPNKWPSVRQARLEELTKLIPLIPTIIRHAA